MRPSLAVYVTDARVGTSKQPNQKKTRCKICLGCAQYPHRQMHALLGGRVVQDSIAFIILLSTTLKLPLNSVQIRIGFIRYFCNPIFLLMRKHKSFRPPLQSIICLSYQYWSYLDVDCGILFALPTGKQKPNRLIWETSVLISMLKCYRL